MKKLWNFLNHHLREDFNIGYYTTIAAFLAICIFLNYYVDFEDNYLEVMTGYPKFFAYLAIYCAAYFFAVFCYVAYNDLWEIFLRSPFWISSIFGLAILSLDSSVPFLDPLISKMVEPPLQFWSFKVGVNFISFFTVFTPIILFRFLYSREPHRYGLGTRHFDASPYFIMLLIMLPLIIGASFNESFLRQYPMYKSSSAHSYLGIPEWITAVIYEFAYGLDFVTVELLFRGFFVIGMMHFLGRGAVLTMAVIYCFLHFGKPAGEAVSSIFGGFILGVIAYETKSIWGGIIVHMGIAWMMESVAFIRKLLF